MAQRASDGKTKTGGLFDDLSFAQVIAGALAAVTSMLLASQIGIYGSVIGVGVGSVVSAVASQLYKKFLQRSADKLRDLHPGETLAMGAKDGAGEGAGAKGDTAQGSRDGATARLDASETTALPTASPRSRSRTPRVDDASLDGDDVVRRARAERQRKKKFKRGVVIVSIVSALLAVAVSAFVIDFVSAGQGVGTKTEPILPSRSQSVDDAPAASSNKDASSGSSSSGTKDDASKDSSKDQNKDSSGDQGSSGSGSGSGTDSGSSSGSGSSGSDSSSGSGSGSDAGSSGSGGSSGSDGSSSGGGSGSGDTGLGGATPNTGSDGSSGGSGSGSGSASGSTGSGSTAGSTTGSGASGTLGSAQPAAAATAPAAL